MWQSRFKATLRAYYNIARRTLFIYVCSPRRSEVSHSYMQSFARDHVRGADGRHHRGLEALCQQRRSLSVKKDKLESRAETISRVINKLIGSINV